ncbi:hypothetical protein MASR2M66_29690 [Chloroflexota bacterium]
MKGQHIGLEPNGPTLPNSGSINIASFDDAEENTAGVMDYSSGDLELVRDSDNQQVGVRFNGVNIPQGATILDAYIQFAVDETNSEATSLTIHGEAADNSFLLSTTKISLRPRTSSSVAWSPVPWLTLNQSGSDQRTPSLVPIVQELVNRSGWDPGMAMTFIITGTGKRVAISEDGAGTDGTAPRLIVSYTMSPVNTPTPSLTPAPTATFTPAPTQTSTPASTATPTVYTLVLQPNGTDGLDTNIVSTSATTNYGTSADMGVGENNDSTNKYSRSLIKFDLSSLPANATITTATLSLWTSSDLSSNDRTIQVYRLKVPFVEGQATWNRSVTGTNWQVVGASGANDRESSAIGSTLILNNEPLNTEKQIVLDTAKIQEFVNGSFTNNGFILVADTEVNDRFNYKTSDTATATQRPKLVIQYTIGGSTPTPVSTFTPTVSLTPTNTSTSSPTPTGLTNTNTPTATNTNTPTQTSTNTATPTNAATPTFSPTPTFTFTPTFTPTPTTPPVPVFSNASFTYDGDGKRVTSTIATNIANTTTYFVGNYYELTGTTVTKYYYAGTQRIAMRKDGTLYYLIGDHLGSTSIVTDANGAIVSETKYKAWGEVRSELGTSPSNYTYTGQYSYASDFGLLFYNARWVDPSLGRFAQADTIVPPGVQGYDRYAYVANNPLRYIDPTGHRNCEEDGYNCPGDSKASVRWSKIKSFFTPKDNYEGPWAWDHNRRQVIAKNKFSSENLTCSPSWVCIPASIQRGIYQENRIVLTGEILEDIKNDPRIEDIESRIVSSVLNDPRYKVEEFTRIRSYPNSITLGDDFGPWYVDAKRPVTWVARAVNVGVDIHVLKTGEIYLNYEFSDVLDLRPDWSNPDREAYNYAVAYFFGPIYHEFLGGSDEMIVHAQWMTKIDPSDPRH